MNSACRMGLVVLAIITLRPGTALAQSAVKLQGEGAVKVSTTGTSSFLLAGTASHLGKCRCHGEVLLAPGAKVGALQGDGVGVVVAADGARLVGVVSWQIEPDGTGQVTFSWRDFVRSAMGRLSPQVDASYAPARPARQPRFGTRRQLTASLPS